MRDFGFGVAIPISFMHAGKKKRSGTTIPAKIITDVSR